MNPNQTLHIYCRVSNEQRGGVITPGNQKEYGIAKAEELGLGYVIYEDADRWANDESFKHHPQLQLLLDEVIKGNVKNIFVREFLRLSRNELTQAILKGLFAKNEVTLYTKDSLMEFSDRPPDLLHALRAMIARENNGGKVPQGAAGNTAARSRTDARELESGDVSLLKGLIRCAKCGRPFYGFMGQNNRANVYVCMSKRFRCFCGCKSIDITVLNNAVWTALADGSAGTSIGMHRLEEAARFDRAAIDEELKVCTARIDALDDERKIIMSRGRKGIMADEDVIRQTTAIDAEKVQLLDRVMKAGNHIELSDHRDELAKGRPDEPETSTVDSRIRGARSDRAKRVLLLSLIDTITVDETDRRHMVRINVKYPLFANGDASTTSLAIEGRRSRGA